MHLPIKPRFLLLPCLWLGLSGWLKAETDLEQATRLIKGRNYQEAQVILDRNVHAEPRNAGVWYQMGELQRATRNDGKALECADKAIQIDPGKASYHILRGQSLGRIASKPANLLLIFRGMRLAKDGLAAMEKAVQLEPANRTAVISLFKWYMLPAIAGGNQDKARALAERTLTLDPSRGHFLKGLLLDEQDQPDAAQAAYRLALREDPTFSEVYHVLGYGALHRKQVDLALDHFRRQVELDPENPKCHESLGEGWLAKGNPDEAIKAFRQALALDPLYPPYMDSLGKTLERAGRRDEAIAFYRHCAKVGVEKGLPEVASESNKRLKGLEAKAS